MPLSKEQQAQLEELERLRDAPEPEEKGAGTGRVLNVNLDLGDDAQVERAFKLGLLERPAADDDATDDDATDDDEDGPRRRGFFDDKDK